MPLGVSYKRNQIERALQALLYDGPPREAYLRLGQEVSKSVRYTLKRLLEIDREWGRANRDRVDELGLAFFDVLPDGSGYDVPYSAQRVFNMAVALQLVDFGFRLKEVVEQIAWLQPQLEEAFRHATETLKTRGRFTQTNSTERDLPMTRTPSGKAERSDPSVFLIVHRVKASERLARLSGDGRGDQLIAPEVCFSWADLERSLKRLVPQETLNVFLIELGTTAARLVEVLDQQPVVKRGRQRP